MESWLDLGVLKALGEEAEYCRVDATLMLLAANEQAQVQTEPDRATPTTIREFFENTIMSLCYMALYDCRPYMCTGR